MLPGAADAASTRLRASRVSPRKRCHGASLVAVENEQELALDDDGIYKDGFSLATCDADISPEAVRWNFKDHACGEVADCGLLHLPMTPRMCFDFCRQKEEMKFFGLKQGRECYCAPYFHAASSGGQGECNTPCEGDAKEMCGGMEKSSLFEMHLCSNSVDKASLALQQGGAASALTHSAAAAATQTATDVRALAQAWQLGVCSVEPEGPRVCNYAEAWLSAAAALGESAAAAGHAAKLLDGKVAALAAEKAKAQAAGAAPDASAVTSMELTTADVRDLSAKAMGAAAKTNLTLTSIAGPVNGRSYEKFQEIFEPVGSGSALCALEMIPGEFYVAVAAVDPSRCADRCLSLSTGLQACVAFNYQHKGGLAACQLLMQEGLLQPKDSISMSVPIFEVDAAKATAMGLSSSACYAKIGFMAAHPKGSLGTVVVRTIQ